MRREKYRKNHNSTNSSPAGGALSVEKSTTPKIPLGIEELTLEKIKQNRDLGLDALVDQLIQDLHYDRDRILLRLMQLESSRKITVKEKVPYRSFFSYAMSPSSLWFWAALAATLLSLSLIGVTGGVALYLRFVFGGLLILYLPGFSLIEFLYTKKKELDQLIRLALSIGLSLAIVPLIGLVLNYTPFGIRLIPVAISLATFAIIFLVLGLRKKHSYYKISNDIL